MDEQLDNVTVFHLLVLEGSSTFIRGLCQHIVDVNQTVVTIVIPAPCEGILCLAEPNRIITLLESIFLSVCIGKAEGNHAGRIHVDINDHLVIIDYLGRFDIYGHAFCYADLIHLVVRHVTAFHYILTIDLQADEIVSDFGLYEDVCYCFNDFHCIAAPAECQDRVNVILAGPYRSGIDVVNVDGGTQGLVLLYIHHNLGVLGDEGLGAPIEIIDGLAADAHGVELIVSRVTCQVEVLTGLHGEALVVLGTYLTILCHHAGEEVLATFRKIEGNLAVLVGVL